MYLQIYYTPIILLSARESGFSILPDSVPDTLSVMTENERPQLQRKQTFFQGIREPIDLLY